MKSTHTRKERVTTNETNKHFMKIRNITLICTAIAASVLTTSCSTESLSEYERTKSAFIDNINGKLNPTQMWRTAVTLNMNVSADAPVKMWLMSGKESGTLFDYGEWDGSKAVSLIMPQGQGNSAYIVSVCDHNKIITPIELTGQTEQTVNLHTSSKYERMFDASEEKDAHETTAPLKTAKANTAASLRGNSIAGGTKYNQFSDVQKDEGIAMLDNYYIEYYPAKDLGLNCDYELESKGDFEITWFAGNCSSSTPHVLGYYYHTPGTYDDIVYVDLSETEIYDYIDGMPKVQYQVDEEAASQYGVSARTWYNANFDMGDTFENPHPNLPARLNDDEYNSIDVYKRYGKHISALRGICFTIKVPEGKRIGFYDRVENVSLPSQYDRLTRLGIKPYTSRDKYKAMNFSAEGFNHNLNQKGSYRSCILKNENTYWIGMENDYTGGDLDCNDVMFAISADVEIHRPDIVVPDISPSADYDGCMPWTIAFEDVHRNADFDFNDAVIKIVPDYEKERCSITLEAAGSTNRMYLHYDGPDGDTNLGEIHELLGASADEEVNTLTAIAQTPFVELDNVKWPKGYTVKDDAKRFYIEVKRGSCSDCSDLLTISDTPGQLPQALLVAGEWKWPLEGTNITTTYDKFANWAKDITKMTFWNWYSYPKANTFVNY